MCAITSTGTSMGGAQPGLMWLIMGRAILVLIVHNESPASGQAPDEEGPDS